MKKSSLGSLVRKVHEDEQGAVSLETILIIGAIAPADLDLPDQGRLAADQGVTSTKAWRTWKREPRGPRTDWAYVADPGSPMVATVLLLGLLWSPRQPTCARHKIYNWTTYPGIAGRAGAQRRRCGAGPGGRRGSREARPTGWDGSALAPERSGFLVCGFVLAGLLRVVQGRRRRRQADGHAGRFLGPDEGSRPCSGRSCSADAWA